MSESMSSQFSDFSDLLNPEGPAAIVINQSLAPANEGDPIIFPPTYPLTTFKGRVHTVLDGDYRVSVELPAYPRADKNEKSADQTPGYNIDRFPDGTNSCEIDSPQSQANRIEPEFKKPGTRDLVPQIEIRVGTDPTNATTVNLLDAGHRAADAVVRMSSLASLFHTAFLDAKAGNHFTLATIAPTSLLFGVWDSRSTQVKLQRVLKSSIRASNVRECTRSAQFSPAADYVAAGATGAALDQDSLSSEGMKHALAIQKAGGVMLTLPASKLTRTVNLNLVALRALRAGDAPHTDALQHYILGLALLAATLDPDLNLREGCNLRFVDAADTPMLVPRRGRPRPLALDRTAVATFARESAEKFFEIAGISFNQKDHLDAVFESGVAEQFLEMKTEDRDKVRSLGPITEATLKRFRDLNRDPFKSVTDALKKAKPKKGERPTQDAEALRPVFDALRQMSSDTSIPDDAKAVAIELAGLAEGQLDPITTLKQIETKLKAFQKSSKDAARAGTDAADTTPNA